MNNSAERNRYLIIFALSAPGAVIVWLVFHAVYFDLSESEKAVGYVDPTTQAGILLGYVVMVGGTLALALTAAWSGVQLVRVLLRRRPR
jgi:hypothetical protein